MNKTFMRMMLLGMCLGICGCKLKRETLDNNAGSAAQEMEAEILHVRPQQVKDLDRDAITMAFFQCHDTEAEKYCVKSYYELQKRIREKYDSADESNDLYEDGSRVLSLNHIGDTNGAVIEYYENGVSEFYQYDSNGYLSEGLGASMELQFPSIDLENGSREEAIAACSQYAAVCGYQDADVSVFAMTKEALEKYTKDNGFEIGAPDPDYQPQSKEAYYHTLLRRLEAEEAGDQETVEEIDADRMKAGTVKFVPWEKKDEAYLLVYRPRINGLLIDGYLQSLQIVYLPESGRIVHLRGYVPFVPERAEKKSIISKEQAITAAMLNLGIEKTDEIEIRNTELVYSYRATQVYGPDPVIEPCWKIDYQLPNMYYGDPGTIRINAIDGSVSQFVNPL